MIMIKENIGQRRVAQDKRRFVLSQSWINTKKWCENRLIRANGISQKKRINNCEFAPREKVSPARSNRAARLVAKLYYKIIPLFDFQRHILEQ